MARPLLKLRDRNPALVDAWTRVFKGCADVECSCGDILGETADAIVSPANSFGFMDGGIDLVYLERFGWDLQDRLREHLARQFAGELPVGSATLIETYDVQIPWLVSAPTMRVPEDVSGSVNAYLAFRAGLQAVLRHNQSASEPIRSLLCPGLATEIGRMPAERAARQMYEAYAVVILGQATTPATLGQAVDHHHWLRR